MAGSTTHMLVCPCLASPDHHPVKPSVPLALSRFTVRRPTSTIHDQSATWAAEPTI